MFSSIRLVDPFKVGYQISFINDNRCSHEFENHQLVGVTTVKFISNNQCQIDHSGIKLLHFEISLSDSR